MRGQARTADKVRVFHFQLDTLLQFLLHHRFGNRSRCAIYDLQPERKFVTPAFSFEHGLFFSDSFGDESHLLEIAVLAFPVGAGNSLVEQHWS
jgi:hypothetical protein